MAPRLAVVTGIVALATARPAHALGPLDIEMAGEVGYGTNTVGPGFGGRGGVTLSGFYFGIVAVDYLGQSTTIEPHVSGGQTNVFTVGGAVGYGLKVAFVTLRPLVGVGGAIFSFEPPPPQPHIGVVGYSGGGAYVQPGGLVQFAFGHLICGVEASAFIAMANGATGGAFIIDGQVGARF